MQLSCRDVSKKINFKFYFSFDLSCSLLFVFVTMQHLHVTMVKNGRAWCWNISLHFYLYVYSGYLSAFFQKTPKPAFFWKKDQKKSIFHFRPQQVGGGGKVTFCPKIMLKVAKTRKNTRKSSKKVCFFRQKFLPENTKLDLACRLNYWLNPS